MNTNRCAQRRQKLMSGFRKAGIDGLLVTNPRNVTYLTGFSGEDSYLLISAPKTVLLTDSRFTTQLADECPGLELESRTAKTSMADTIARVVPQCRIEKLGFDSQNVTANQFEDWGTRLKTVRLVPAPGLVEELRQIKDADEIAEIRKAIRFAERGFEVVRAMLTPEMTEAEAASELEYAMRRFGATKFAFDPIIAVGPRAALPHGRAGTSRMGDSKFVLFDWGALTDKGYRSDLTRTIATGKVSAKMEKVYRVVLEAQLAAIALIKPGAKCVDVDAAARKVIEDAGFGQYFGHGLGHGIGLDVHESVRFSPTSKDELKPGMIMTVEPGIYLPGYGGVRIEDDVLVTKDGYEVLSSVSKSAEEFVTSRLFPAA